MRKMYLDISYTEQNLLIHKVFWNCEVEEIILE